METAKPIKYWYISRHPETNEIQFNINLPKPEKDLVFSRTSEGWILDANEEKYLLTWENNYKSLHANGCFCEGKCIFVREAMLIDNIFLSRKETSYILDKLCDETNNKEDGNN